MRKASACTLAAASGPILGMLGMAAAPEAAAADATQRATDAQCPAARLWSASLRWENDTFSGNDRFYTDGAALAIAHTGPSWMDPVANWLPWGEGRRTVAYDVAQAMFTPQDTELSVPDPDDRPYAGILAFGLTLHVDQERSYHGLAHLVLRDITLDGNTFEDSPSVDKELFVPMAGVGLSVGNRRFQVSFAYIFWGKEFEGQEDYSEFGTLAVSYIF